jgi:hypothetical protein
MSVKAGGGQTGGTFTLLEWPGACRVRAAGAPP